MIQRNNTSYLNEPHVNGGSPIASSGKVMLNDLLGTNLGIKGEEFTAISRTAFGALRATSDSDQAADNFFTGKPMIGELGYAFLVRNYRADIGKWQTADPLGYPDGWNNFNYARNNVINNIDLWGAKVYAVARDLVGFPFGNHQFFAFVPDNPADFSGKLTDLGDGKQGMTSGGQKGESGNLETENNNAADIKSLQEYFDPANNTNWYSPDYDAELREIPTPIGMTDTQFIQQLQDIISTYNDNCPYDVNDTDCATWLNTMLEKAGFSEDFRRELLDFFGIDGGFGKLLDEQYFE